jgi:hypothetical protein
MAAIEEILAGEGGIAARPAPASFPLLSDRAVAAEQALV